MKIELSDSEIRFIICALVQNYAEEACDFSADITSHGPAMNIVGKLAMNVSKGHDTYCEAKDGRYIKHPIEKTLFLGNGWHSTIDCNNLHKRLNYAFSMLSGQQQNGGMGHEFDEEFDKKSKQDIKAVVNDILKAFDLTPDDLK